jgi:D-methionine transport system permease protein
VIDHLVRWFGADPSWSRLGPQLGEAFGDTLWMVLVTIVFGGVLGLILGVVLYCSRPSGLLENRLAHIVLNVAVNVVRPIPFVLLVAALGPITLGLIHTTIGVQAAVFVMVVSAAFAIARIVEQNLVTIDPGVIEAARAVGAGPLRIILTLLIPEALGPLILGYTFVLVGVVDMSAMAGVVGGGGVGDFAITYGYNRFRWDVTFVSVLIIIVFVQLAQFLGNYLAGKALRR